MNEQRYITNHIVTRIRVLFNFIPKIKQINIEIDKFLQV